MAALTQNPPMRSRATVVRLGTALLLIWAAYWAALPWLDCMRSVGQFGLRPAIDIGLSACTFGSTNGPSGHYLNVLVAVIYVAAGCWLAVRTRFA